MPLPSQSARPIARRSYMYRRSRHRRRPVAVIVAAVIVVAAAGVTWAFWPDGEAAATPEPASSTSLARGGGARTPGPKTATPVDSAATARRKPAPAERTPTPDRTKVAAAPEEELEMGRAVADRAEPTPADPPKPKTPTRTVTEPAVETATTREPTPPPARAAALPAASPAFLGDTTLRARDNVRSGLDLLARNRLVDGRRRLTEVLASGGLSPQDAEMVRDRLAALNERMVFSPEVVEGDPFVIVYAIESGDLLSRLPKKLGADTDWRFIQRINRIAKPQRIRAGQRVKVVTGPFHAVVHKNAYRLDLYLGDGAGRVFVRSFDVGLGEYDSTPVGRFRIRPQSKLINPAWANPRTAERFDPEDPDNPIGEHWVGLVGDEEHLRSVTGYGIHGTIEPASIGHQSSMGCVRMRPEDVAIVWELLDEKTSTVEIRP